MGHNCSVNPYRVARFWVILIRMSVKAFEPQVFERAVIDALRSEMARQHMSRRTLSERSGISKSRVIRLFADDGPSSPVTLTVLESICGALRVPMSAILAQAERCLSAEESVTTSHSRSEGE